MIVRKGKKPPINQSYTKGRAIVNGVSVPAWRQTIFGDSTYYSATGKEIEVSHFNSEEYFAPKERTQTEK